MGQAREQQSIYNTRERSNGRLPMNAIQGGLPFLIEPFCAARPANDHGKLDHYLLFWSSSGCGKFRMRLTNRDLPKGRLFFLKPGTVQAFLRFAPEGWVIRFRPQYLRPGLSDRLQLLFLARHNYVDLDSAQLEKLNTLAQYMLEAYYDDPDPALLTDYICLVVELAGNIFRKKHHVANVQPYERLLLRLFALIDVHFKEQLTTGFYAKQLGIVDRKLNEICSKGTGFLVPELIEDRRLSEAEALLSGSKKLLKEVAAELKFLNTSHFAYWFRQRLGRSPKEYRALTLKDTQTR